MKCICTTNHHAGCGPATKGGEGFCFDCINKHECDKKLLEVLLCHHQSPDKDADCYLALDHEGDHAYQGQLFQM